MPEWSHKDQRMYEHGNSSSMDRGRTEQKAKDLAARTVHKQGREEGRTPNKSTQATGKPNKRLRARTVKELRNLAAEWSVVGSSKMKKAELVFAIREEQS